MTRNDVDTQTTWQFKVCFVSLKTLVKHLFGWIIYSTVSSILTNNNKVGKRLQTTIGPWQLNKLLYSRNLICHFYWKSYFFLPHNEEQQRTTYIVAFRNPFHMIHDNVFQWNELYGTKRQATELFRRQPAHGSSWVMQSSDVKQFHPMITRQSAYHGWSQCENQNKLQETDPLHF